MTLDSAFSPSNVDDSDNAQLPAPPAVIHVPAVAARGKRAAKAVPPSPTLFASALAGSHTWGMTVTADQSHGIDVTVSDATDTLCVAYQGENDRTLIPTLKGRKGYNDGWNEAAIPGNAALPVLRTSVQASIVVEALDFVAIAMSQDVTRYNLHGVYFAPNGDVVSTDGHRLHLYQGMPAPFDAPFFLSRGAIVPAHAVKTLIRAIKATKASRVEFGRDENKPEYAWFRLVGETLRVEYCVRLVDGQFPDYQQVIPSTDGKACFRGDVKELRVAIKSAPLIGDKCVARKLGFGEWGAFTWRHDGARIALPLEGKASATIHVNARYLDDALADMVVDVAFYVDDDLSPVVIANGPRTAVIMPMRA